MLIMHTLNFVLWTIHVSKNSKIKKKEEEVCYCVKALLRKSKLIVKYLHDEFVAMKLKNAFRNFWIIHTHIPWIISKIGDFSMQTHITLDYYYTFYIKHLFNYSPFEKVIFLFFSYSNSTDWNIITYTFSHIKSTNKITMQRNVDEIEKCIIFEKKFFFSKSNSFERMINEH